MTSSIGEWAVIAVFVLWALLALIYQFKRARIKSFGLWAQLGLLPTWTFFAPRPGTTDHHLLYRDRLASGTVLAWRQTLMTPKRWWKVWGDSSMRESKALIDANQILLHRVRQSQVQEEERSLVVGSVPYLLLLNYVSALPHEPGTSSVQFLLMQSEHGGFSQQPVALFLSDFHPLSTEVEAGASLRGVTSPACHQQEVAPVLAEEPESLKEEGKGGSECRVTEESRK